MEYLKYIPKWFFGVVAACIIILIAGFVGMTTISYYDGSKFNFAGYEIGVSGKILSQHEELKVKHKILQKQYNELKLEKEKFENQLHTLVYSKQQGYQKLESYSRGRSGMKRHQLSI